MLHLYVPWLSTDPGFKASNGWLNKFKAGHGLSTRQATSISRKLPKDAEEKNLQFHHLIIDLYDQHDYRPKMFPKWMRCYWNSTWSATAPYRREDCAAVYKWCWEEGLHLHLDHGCWWHQAPTDSRLQGETRPKDECSWSPRHWAGKRHHPRGSLPEVDHHNIPQGEWRPSLSVGVGQLPCSYHWVCQRSLVSQTDVAIIPGGLTHVLQPLDVSINHPFKHLVHKEWLEWTSGAAEYTKGGKHHLQSKELVCTWITKAWKEVDIAIITNSFLKFGNGNAPHGSKDDLLFDESCRPLRDAEMDTETEEDDCIIWDNSTVPVLPALLDCDDS